MINKYAPVARLQPRISSNSQGLAQVKTEVDKHDTDISKDKSDISDVQTQVAKNAGDIKTDQNNVQVICARQGCLWQHHAVAAVDAKPA